MMQNLHSIAKIVIEKVLSDTIRLEENRLEVYGDFLVQQAKEMRNVIEKYFEEIYKKTVDYLDTIPELNIVQKINNYSADIFQEITNLDGYELQISGFLGSAFNYGAEDQQGVLGAIGISLNLDNEYANQRAKDNAASMISRIDDTTKNRINNLIAKGLESGVSKSDMIKQLQADYSFSKYRANLIANTELGNAFVAGRAKQWEEYQKETGEVGFKHRVDQEDARECEECLANASEGWIPANQPHYSGHQHPLAHPGCYHRDTKVMTDKGWKLFSELKGDEKCLSINPTTHNAEYVGIKKIIRTEAEELVKLYNTSFELQITKNHSLCVVKENEYERIRFVETGGELKPNWKIPRIFKWDLGVESIDDDFVRFMAWYLGEGSTTKRGENWYQIKIAQQQGTKYYERIATLIQKLGYKVSKCKGGLCFNDTALGQYLIGFGRSFDKFIPDKIKNSTQRQIQIFLDEYVLGDGYKRQRTHKGKGFISTEISYYTSSPQLMSDLCELIAKIGHRPSIYEIQPKTITFRNGTYTSNGICYKINQCNKSYSYIKKLNKEIIPYSGDVRCVELEKYHTLYVMINGKVSICGNCRCDEQWLPILPDGEEFHEFMNPDTYKTYDSTWISDDKLPDNYDKYSLKVAPPFFIESLGAKVIYRKPSDGAYFDRTNNVIQRGISGSIIIDKHAEIHELGHALYATNISNDFAKVKRLTEVMDTGIEEFYKTQDKVLDFMKKIDTSEIKNILTAIKWNEYKYIETTVSINTTVNTMDRIASDKLKNDITALQDVIALLKGEDTEGRPTDYYDDVDMRLHEMFANITEVYFYDNKLLEKILPKTYTMMKKFYDEIGFNFL